MRTIVLVEFRDGWKDAIYLFSSLSEAEKRVAQWIWKQARDGRFGQKFRDEMAVLMGRENYREMIDIWNKAPLPCMAFISVSEQYLDAREIR